MLIFKIFKVSSLFFDYLFSSVDTYFMDKIAPLFSLKILTTFFPLFQHKLIPITYFPMLAYLHLSFILGIFLRCLVIFVCMLIHTSWALKDLLGCLYMYMCVYVCLWLDGGLYFKVFLLGYLTGDFKSNVWIFFLVTSSDSPDKNIFLFERTKPGANILRVRRDKELEISV